MVDVYNHLGEWIREVRIAAGLSQAELGRALSDAIGHQDSVTHQDRVSEEDVARIEQGILSLPADLRVAIAEVLGEPVAFLSSPNNIEDTRRHGTPNGNSDLETWKDNAGLPREFPWLGDLTDDDLAQNKKFYLGPAHKKAVAEILQRVEERSRPNANPLFVRVERGHGCTTLSRYLVRATAQGSDSLQDRIIPVHIGLDDLTYTVDGSTLCESVRDTIRHGIIQRLVSSYWLTEVSKASVEPADPSTRNTGATRWGRREQARLKRLRTILATASPSEDEWELVARLTDELAERAERRTSTGRAKVSSLQLTTDLEADGDGLTELVKSLPDSSVALHVDCSSELAYTNTHHHEKALVELAVSIRKTCEHGLGNTEVDLSSKFYTIYFCDAGTYELIRKTSGSEQENTVRYPSYETRDILSILAHHHLSTIPEGVRTERLTTCMRAELLEGIVTPELPIAVSVLLLERRLRLAAEKGRMPSHFLSGLGFQEEYAS